MSTTTRQSDTITPDNGADNLRAPTRDELARAEKVLLKQGGPTKANLHVIDLGQGPLVVKDFAAKSWWVRQIGRLQISRETAAYRAIGRRRGVPRFAGRIDRYALAVEKIDGEHLGWSPLRETRGPQMYDRLCEIVGQMHAMGMVHWDLRARENVMVTPDAEVYVLDFASVFRLRPGGLRHRMLFSAMRTIDDSALLKWKKVLNAGEYTDAELRFLRRFGFSRSLWILNPKGMRRQRDQAEKKNGGG